MRKIFTALLVCLAVGLTAPQSFAQSNKEPFTWFLRKDVPDISLFSGITPAAGAAGAQGSFTWDRIADDRIWAAYGIGGVSWRVLSGDYPSSDRTTLIGFFIAPYVGLNKVTHSNRKLTAKNLDTTLGGVKAEVGFANLLGGHHYFRAGGGVVTDDINDTTAAAFSFEWIPVYRGFENTIFYGLRYTFQPSLKVQYDATTDEKQPLLFSNRPEALRVGPELSFKLVPIEEVRKTQWYGRFNVNLTYHSYYETYSGRSLSWFDGSITYNIDSEGHFGLTTSYRNGADENTGKDTDIFVVSLSGKF
jgi:hypothetical protein